MTEKEDTTARTEKQLAQGLSDVYSFVRSVEINKSLSAVTMDNLLSEAIALLDNAQLAEDTDAASVDSTGRALFVLEDESSLVKRKGKLQRLATLAGNVLSKSQFDSLGFSSQYDEIRNEMIQDEKSLFERLRDEEYLKSLVETSDPGEPQYGGQLVQVTYRFTVGDETVDFQKWVPEDLLTPEQRTAPGGVIILDMANGVSP